MSQLETISFLLPYPPSWNALYRFGKGKMFKTSEYLTWIKAAQAAVLQQKVPKRTYTSPIAVIAEVGAPDKRQRDLDNVFKAVGDVLETVKIVENDHLIHRWDIAWSKDVSNGVMLTIRPMGAE